MSKKWRYEILIENPIEKKVGVKIYKENLIEKKAYWFKCPFIVFVSYLFI